MSRNVLFFLFLFSSILSFSQQRRFSHIGLPEGLPQETVLCMTTDTLGMVWLGTSDGLVRFDGSQFHLPLADDASQLDIAGYRIGALATYKNYILAGTGQKGLMTYNVMNETTQSLGNISSNCTAILPLEKGFIAAYFNGSISYFTDTLEEIKLNFSNQVPQRINALAIYNNQLFIGTDDGNLLSGFWNAKSTTIDLTSIHLPTTKVNFLKVATQKLWIGTTENLFQIDNTSHTPVIVEIPFCTSKPEGINITDIVQANNSSFLATSAGLYEWSSNTCAKQYISAEKNSSFNLNANAINDLHLVNETLLIGHITLDLTEIKPPDVFKLPSDLWNLDNPSVFAVRRSGKYLFAGTSSGLVISLADDPSVFNLFPEFRIRGITEDASQNIWFVTGNGAFVIPLEGLKIHNPEFIEVPVSEETQTYLTSENLRNVFTDKQGRVWITTFSKGLCKFEGNVNIRDFTFRRYAFSEAEAKKLPSPLTLSVTQDQNESYWISTQKGLSKMTLDASENPAFTTYKEEQGLITNGVLSSFVAKDGTLWVASRKGLNKYLPEEDRFISYGKRDGLSNTFVYNVSEDSQKSLWLTTNGGLFRFNPTTEHFSNYLPKDGVQSTEFNLGAIFHDLDSELLYAGGIAGFNIFDPARVNELDQPAPLVFTSLKSKGELIRAGVKSNTAKTISSTASLTFRYDDFPISLSYSALDFRPSKNINYEYRLLPQDKQWNTLANSQDIQLLNLSPGTYTIELRGLSRGIPWNDTPLALELKIKPPWYRSTSAYLAYGLLIAAIVFIFYRIRLQRRLAGEEAKRLQDLDDLKTRFITNITHEFRTPLTIILGYIDTLKNKLTGQTEQNEDLKIIENNSTNLLHLVNQMLDLAKLEKGRLNLDYQKDDLVAFAESITNSFKNTAQEKGVQLQFETDFSDPMVDFDAEKIRQILSNLVSNSLKFTKEGDVSVVLTEQETHYSIKVKDTGHGISEEEQASIFERFYQVENNNFKVSQGTGIGLALTKELVLLMNGNIDVTSKSNQGTTFTITLPLTRLADTAQFGLSVNTIPNGIEVPAYQEALNNEEDHLVLVVEDNPDMSRYIGSCLQPHYKVIFAFNGQEGLAKATEHTPDIIVSDVMMPIVDGFEMTQNLQQQETTNHIPIILLTSKAEQDDKLEGLESGADAYLTKPFQKKELLLRMTKLIEKRHILQQKYEVTQLLKPERREAKVLDKNELFLQKTIALIHESIEDHTFGSKQLANELALSESQLYRKLKAISNTSTAIFIRTVRLTKAKELLLTTSKNVSEVAYETGFNDPNWFGKIFKEKFGVPPSEIRKNL